MKIIDANTGHEPRIGVPFENINGLVTVLQVKERLLSAKALIELNCHQRWVPLQVRYTHPGFFFQKVAFIPSLI